MFSLTIAAMFGTFVFFVLAKENIAVKYRPAIVVSGLVVLIADTTTSVFSKAGTKRIPLVKTECMSQQGYLSMTPIAMWIGC